jgi:flap endonuclease-1
MGIQSFSEFLKQRVPNPYFEVPLQNLQDKRLAIDVSHVAYAMMSIAIKEVTDQTNLATERPDQTEIERLALDKIVARLVLFLQHGITPVCIFDSKSHPLKEAHVKVKRKADRDKIENKLKNAETNLYSVDVLFRTQTVIDEYAKYFKQFNNIPHDFMHQLKDVLTTVGFPVFSAEDFGLETTDAEGVCAALCLKGNDYCYAAVCNDSDFHVYGGNLGIVDIYQKNKTYYTKVRSLEAILQQSGLTFDQFRDLCILMGTDFNPNIKNVGPKRSWDYIAKYGSIANMAKNGVNVSILNYPNVFKIFASTITKINIPSPVFNVEKFREHGRNVFDLYHLRDHASSIANTLDKTSIPESVSSVITL